MRHSGSNKKEPDMNLLSRSPGRTIASALTRYRTQRQRIVTERLMEQLPHRIKRDVGWPPYGNLDERCGS